MTTQITPAIILDLMPLYLAGEVSADTRALIEEYLATDPQLAQVAREAKTLGLPSQIPNPITKEKAMETFQEAKKWMAVQTAIIAGTIGLVTMCTLAMIFGAALLFYLTGR